MNPREIFVFKKLHTTNPPYNTNDMTLTATFPGFTKIIVVIHKNIEINRIDCPSVIAPSFNELINKGTPKNNPVNAATAEETNAFIFILNFSA
jgi:D-ribose pyranose/furanose isomerase RbsD